ncbi:MAG TPA: hypothetical protein VN260_04815, partial [Dissulfurispiraceae bacterium]|nr:hypothetical protein [Dissulfurispiraceae bacterium]
ILKFDNFFSALRSSAELLQRYFAMAIVLILSLLIYISFIALLWVFVVGGTVGSLTDLILGRTDRSTLRSFFEQGRRYFIPLFLFSLLIGVIVIMIAFILGVLGGGVSAVIEYAQSQEATLALFLGIFFSLILLSAGGMMILVTLSVTVYGMAEITFNRTGPIGALRETLSYICRFPAATGFYSLLIVGYMIANILVIFLVSPLALIPIVGSILSLPFQVFISLVQGYLGLVVLASVFYYFRETGYRVSPPEEGTDSDTSDQPVEEPAPAPAETDETVQG